MRERRLIVHLDPIAALRQERGGVDPDPVAAATLALLAGADGVAAHLREDRRHIQDRDVRVLRQTVQGRFFLDVEALPEMVKVALEIRPDAVTLLPGLPAELSAPRGLDVPPQLAGLGEIVRALEDGRIRSSLLVSPDLEQIKAVHRVGAGAVQIHTGRFAEGGPDRDDEQSRIDDAVRLAAKLGLEVSVRGGLDYRNVKALLVLEDVSEFHVGHAIAARAVLVGMDRAVQEMKQLVG